MDCFSIEPGPCGSGSSSYTPPPSGSQEFDNSDTETVTIADQGVSTYNVDTSSAQDEDGLQYSCTVEPLTKTNTTFVLKLSSTPPLGKPVTVAWHLTDA
jgi:hypothetical protein